MSHKLKAKRSSKTPNIYIKQVIINMPQGNTTKSPPSKSVQPETSQITYSVLQWVNLIVNILAGLVKIIFHS